VCCVLLVYFKNGSSTVSINAAITQAAISAAIHLILSLWMLTYGLRMYFFLASSQTKFNIDVRRTRHRAIRRVLTVTVGFALCYFVRSICAILVVLNKFEIIEDNFSRISWFLISQWIPFIVPVGHTCIRFSISHNIIHQVILTASCIYDLI
jgi:uncharacterized membrane protein